MWRFLAFSLTGSVALATAAAAQESALPYGPFDAIREGAERGEVRRLSLIDSQLDTVDQLRLRQAVAPRVLLRDPAVAAVYTYGRRGILGLRPRGYVVVRRNPVVVYRRSDAVAQPLYDLGYDAFGYPMRQAFRQPIGHELLRTGPNRWEYRPLYAEDDRQLDETRRAIGRNLRARYERYGVDQNGYATSGPEGRDASRVDDEPEELPEPQDVRSAGDNEIRGPLLPNPAAGTREF